jgi:hypothetical protein
MPTCIHTLGFRASVLAVEKNELVACVRVADKDVELISHNGTRRAIAVQAEDSHY